MLNVKKRGPCTHQDHPDTGFAFKEDVPVLLSIQGLARLIRGEESA
jgi:hypothetical protein